MPASVNQDVINAPVGDQIRTLLELVPAAMIIADQEGTITDVSAMTLDLFGYCEQELLGSNLNILMAEPHAARHDGYIKRYLRTDEKRIMASPRVENALRKDGSSFAVEVTVGETTIDGRPCFVGTLRPLQFEETRRQQIQTMLAELSHMSRLSAMGALATAIAHELNQPLTSIANYAEGARDLLKKRSDADDLGEIIDVLDQCSGQALRAGQLLHRLREFVKSGEQNIELVTVEKLVDDSISLALINGYKRSTTIERDIPSDLPMLAVDHLQAEQVLFNLIRNGFQAMEGMKGRWHHMKIAAKQATGGFIEITVEDSGPGVDPAIGERLFESFVTSKSGGMGVGLAICRQIVESYGGRLTLEECGDLGGAQFRLTLPVGVPAAEGVSEADQDLVG